MPPVVSSQCYQGQFCNTFCHSTVVSSLSVFADQTQAHLPTNGQPVLQNTSTAAAAGHLRGLIRNSKFHTNLKFAVQISAKSWVNTDFSNERLFSVMKANLIRLGFNSEKLV